MYIYQEHKIIIDTDQVIDCSQRLAELYNSNHDYKQLRELTDYIDGQTIDYIRYCLNPYEAAGDLLSCQN